MTTTIPASERPTCVFCGKTLKANWNHTTERRMSGRGGMPSTWFVKVRTTIKSFGVDGSHCTKKCARLHAEDQAISKEDAAAWARSLVNSGSVQS